MEERRTERRDRWFETSSPFASSDRGPSDVQPLFKISLCLSKVEEGDEAPVVKTVHNEYTHLSLEDSEESRSPLERPNPPIFREKGGPTKNENNRRERRRVMPS